MKNPNASFSPEVQLIRACVRLDALGEEQTRALLNGPLDWDVVYKTSLEYAVLPLLYKGIQAGIQGPLPEEIGKIRAGFIANAHRNIRLTKTAIQVFDLLKQHGIESLVLKGPATAVLFYGDLSLRSFADLDFLIHPKDFSHAHQVLINSGWQPSLSIGEKEKKWLLRGDKDLAYSLDGVNLELHWNITEKGISYPFPEVDLWLNPHSLQILDRQVQTLSPENTLIFLALHGAKHQWRPVKLIVDFAACLRSFPDLDWHLIDEKSRQYGLRRCMGLGISLADSQVGISVPAPVAHALQKDPHVSRLADIVQEQLISPDQANPTWIAFYLQVRERARDRAYFVMDQLLFPKQVDWLSLPLPGFLYPLYFLLRPCRLFYKLGFLPLRDYLLCKLRRVIAFQ
jgi:hypothetical protein